MRFRLSPWLILLLVVAICGGVIALVALLRARHASTASLLERLPADDAVIVYADFRALRAAGVLELFAESKLSEEPEYRAFVEQSGFDFQQDLDSALISFHPDGNFFLLRGRFDWKMLNSFVTRQGGTCYNTFCRVAGSRPERNISYFPAHHNVMALAVSEDAWAATHMLVRKRGAGIVPPEQPVWSVIPASRLKSANRLPAGARLFAGALAGADRVVLSAGPKGERMEIQLDVTCRSREDAALLVKQLNAVTGTVRELIARENREPDSRDLSGILAAGVFEQNDRRVLGRWPLEKAFFENLAGGAL